VQQQTFLSRQQEHSGLNKTFQINALNLYRRSADCFI